MCLRKTAHLVLALWLCLAPTQLPGADPLPPCEACPIEFMGMFNDQYYFMCECCNNPGTLQSAISDRMHQLGCRTSNPDLCLDPINVATAPVPTPDSPTPTSGTSATLVPLTVGEVPVGLARFNVLRRNALRRTDNSLPLGSGGDPRVDPDVSRYGTFFLVSPNYEIVDDCELEVSLQGPAAAKRYFRVLTIKHRTRNLHVRIGQQIQAVPGATPRLAGTWSGDAGEPLWQVTVTTDQGGVAASQVGKTFHVMPKF